MVAVPLLIAILLWLHAPLTPWDGAWSCLGYVSYTFAEYAYHRVGLHGIFFLKHMQHHAYPHEKIYQINWGVWLVAAVFGYLFGTMFLTGAIAGYGWYLWLHHCSHHNRLALSTEMRSHHDMHHRNGRYNFGVSTVVWDSLFGTRCP